MNYNHSFVKFNKIFKIMDDNNIDSYYPVMRSVASDWTGIGCIAVDSDEIMTDGRDIITTIFYGFEI